ncbi:MAG: substrate-binding domain-containing protein [Planctomycetaceae bacterium]|nr:substrate-binding domain-containing protein [Planctomycetaceae bacterium]
MNKWISVTLCLTMALVAMSCSKQQTSGDEGAKATTQPAAKAVPAEVKKLTIAVIPKGTAHEYWQSVHAGAIKAQRELAAKGKNIEIVWIGPDNESEKSKQIEMVDNMVTKDVAGIVLAPLDSKALVRPVESAMKKNVPVVIIDSALDTPDIVSFVATDNFVGGANGGKHLAAALGGKGKVIMLRYMEGSASTIAREEGFVKAAKDGGLELVSPLDQYAGATTVEAQQAATTLLEKFSDAEGNLTIQGIFCPNQSTALGMLQALRQKRLAGKVKFVGFDGGERLLGGLKEGHIDALVLQNPINMGYLGVVTLAEKLDGKTPAKNVNSGATVITAKDLEDITKPDADPAKKDLIAPDLDKWLK